MNNAVQVVADIGGTNARFAFVHSNSKQLQSMEVFSCADFPLLIDVIRVYMKKACIHPVDKICLAVAGPVGSDWVDLPNNHWAFSRLELQNSLNVPVTVINDFSAQIYSIDALHASELHWIGGPRPCLENKAGKVIAVVGPGTGLGVSAMISGSHILPSEAGHVAFAPVDDHEVDLLKILWHRYDRVSIERLLSGLGLENLYWANCRKGGIDRELSAEEISAGAFDGDRYCLRAVNDFFAILGSVAGDVALMMGATNGVYISGGIVPRLLNLLDEDIFRRRFETKGRFSQICAQTPVAIVLAEQPGLIGCVEALKRNTW